MPTGLWKDPLSLYLSRRESLPRKLVSLPILGAAYEDRKRGARRSCHRADETSEAVPRAHCSASSSSVASCISLLLDPRQLISLSSRNLTDENSQTFPSISRN